MALFILFVLVFINYVNSNLRCYSCSPCNELEIYAGDVTHFEQDCYLDRYCMKVSDLKYRGSSNSADFCPKNFAHYSKPHCLN